MDKFEFAIEHRKITFWDEWLSYIAMTSLYALYIHAGWPLWPFVIATVWTTITIAVSYIRQWKMESKLYDNNS